MKEACDDAEVDEPSEEAGSNDVDANLRLFEIDDGSSAEDPRKGLNQTGIFSRIVLNNSEKRWFDDFWKDDKNSIKF